LSERLHSSDDEVSWNDRLGRDPAVQQPEAELRQTTISRHSVQALTSPRNRRKSTLTTSFSLGTDGTLVGR
jgi:hypothetical protein